MLKALVLIFLSGATFTIEQLFEDEFSNDRFSVRSCSIKADDRRYSEGLFVRDLLVEDRRGEISTVWGSM